MTDFMGSFRPATTMRSILFALVVLVLASALPARAQELEKVRVGISPAQSTAGIFIAKEKGYFSAVGLDVEIVPFPGSGPEMLPALASNQLQVGAGNISAKMYNAMARGIQMRIVADKGSNTPHSGYLALVARKALQGRIKGPADLKGLKVALTGPGVSQEVVVDRYLRRGGLTIKDVNVVFLSYQDARAALVTGAADVTVQIEALLTESVTRNEVFILDRADRIYPHQQSAVIVYSEAFASQHRGAAEKFMEAYIRGVRDYRRAFVTRTASPAEVARLVRIFARYCPTKDASIWQRVYPVGLNPDGYVNVPTMLSDLRYYVQQGYVKERPDLRRFIDHSFVQAALKRLGPAR